jgi:hypothetical protein
MASPTGTTRMPTQKIVAAFGQYVVSAPARSTVRRGDRIDDVGFTAKRATTGWPVEMPPRMPPARLERNRVPLLPATVPFRLVDASSDVRCSRQR